MNFPPLNPGAVAWRRDEMATMKDVREGLAILAKYVEENSHCIDAKHDVLYAGPACSGEDAPVSPDDRAALEKLGWHYDDEAESWARFT